jgi:hypothetical protein
VVQVVLKPDAAKKRIEAALEKNALFKGLDKEQINTVIDAVEEEKHKAGDVIIKQGESGLYFYLLEVHNLCPCKHVCNTGFLIKDYQFTGSYTYPSLSIEP